MQIVILWESWPRLGQQSLSIAAAEKQDAYVRRRQSEDFCVLDSSEDRELVAE